MNRPQNRLPLELGRGSSRRVAMPAELSHIAAKPRGTGPGRGGAAILCFPCFLCDSPLAVERKKADPGRAAVCTSCTLSVVTPFLELVQKAAETVAFAQRLVEPLRRASAFGGLAP